ncbi:hypothetical protein [Vulgatibacter incomptus]|uniref:Uncharacterized protein n=1 Tax=Vulgatibacter incomptus TaxID=1391653 RepID=A0A0K1PFK3_9BACT|nr:hypothetical protein [Vulgatibacter incomptus]AKU92295.1 hypothetical protein AKJ08_2682 [Vulgatibacter incomptus]
MDLNTKKKWAVYTIRERQGLEKPYWMRVGVAFMNRDGSFNLHLDATPLDGKLQMREWREEAALSPSAPSGEIMGVAEGKRSRSNGKAQAEAEAAVPF